MPGPENLDRRFRDPAERLLAALRQVDPRFIFTSTYRSSTEQARLYNEWLSGKSLFPALPPGRSLHEYGLAVDIARFGVEAAEDPILREAGAAWRRGGGTWGGETDPVHFGAPRSWWPPALRSPKKAPASRRRSRRRSPRRRRKR